MLTYAWHQPVVEPFDDAEFYEPGPVVTIRNEHGQGFIIYSDGSRDLEETIGNDYRCIRKPEEFRERFPDGVTPSDDGESWHWQYNGWFSTIPLDEEQQGEPDEDISYSLKEAVAEAERALQEVHLGHS